MPAAGWSEDDTKRDCPDLGKFTLVPIKGGGNGPISMLNVCSDIFK
jgi:hypothetical protein